MALPFADLGTPILAALGAPNEISVRRETAGHYDQSIGGTAGGRWVSGSASTLLFTAVVQPLEAREVMLLPEGERTKESIVIFTKVPLQTSDSVAKTESDIVTWAGTTWRVLRVENWMSQAGYAKAIAVKVVP